MDLSTLKPLYQHEGPFATVYLEGRSPSENAATQVRLRWQALRDRLEQQGAPPGPLDALEGELRAGTPGEEQTNGRVLVAGAGGVVLDEPWDAALGVGDAAHWAYLPELGPYARERARSVRMLVVVADQEGAEIRQAVVAEQHHPQALGDETVQGTAIEGVHKPRHGFLSHNQIQRRADEAVDRNAMDVAEHVRRTADRFRPELVVLAGGVQARAAVRDALHDGLAALLVETERGGRDERASDEALNDELLRFAAEESARVAGERAGALRAGQPHEQAAEGDQPVVRAAELGAVDTLLFEEDVRVPRESLLLKTCAETSSAFGLVPGGTGLADGVGALLRFPTRH
ncbi:hypothetical protein [Streptomyces sp. AJS327]|uniref:baeRF2 domain-containing protein n=1 Tax=Streptomyces sp. AJS327 TaxID=2545265 RepID=UPI00215517EA|nr:hypothetical protein [Streptomyces sp. AJS327]